MNQDNDALEGGCGCGEVRYRMEPEPLIVHCCHCSWCQRQTGSSFAVNAMIETDRVQLLKGDVTEVTVPSPCGAGQTIARCPNCQVALWSNYLVGLKGNGKIIRFIRVGTLDDPSQLPPDIHIYTSSKQPWVNIPEGALSVEEYYDSYKTWSEDSLKRMKVLMLQAGNK